MVVGFPLCRSRPDPQTRRKVEPHLHYRRDFLIPLPASPLDQGNACNQERRNQELNPAALPSRKRRQLSQTEIRSSVQGSQTVAAPDLTSVSPFGLRQQFTRPGRQRE